MNNLHKSFAKLIVKEFRDKNYANYLKNAQFSRSITLDEYSNLPKNEDYDKELQKTDDNRFEFINSLNEKQKKQLDLLILKTLDEVAFNFLKEVDQDYHFKEKLGLTFKGKNIDNIYNDFLSGSFFGEYFLWLEKFSKFGKYQH